MYNGSYWLFYSKNWQTSLWEDDRMEIGKKSNKFQTSIFREVLFQKYYPFQILIPT